MKTITKAIGTRETTLGEVEFPLYDNIAELVEAFGEDGVAKLAQRALTVDLERIARDNLKAEKSVEEVQALIASYKPGGGRGDKPTMNNFLNLLNTFGEVGKMDEMMEAHRLFREESLESAYNYLKENQ